MVTGIVIALGILIVGSVSSLNARDGEPILIITILLVTIALTVTLIIAKPPKSDTEKLKELQNYCVSIGVATMTPVVVTTEFQLLATGVVQIKGEADDK